MSDDLLVYERSLLGCMMRNREAFDGASIGADDFSTNDHVEIWKAIAAVYLEGGTPEPLLLRGRCEVGHDGIRDLFDLGEALVPNWRFYAREVKAASVRRSQRRIVLELQDAMVREPDKVPMLARKLSDLNAGASSADGFRLVQFNKLQPTPPNWLVRGLIELDSFGMAFGGPGSCKSFWALDLALCVATGKDFHGHRTKRGPVVIIAGEGLHGLARRRRAWEIHNKVDCSGAPIVISNRSVILLDDRSVAELGRELQSFTVRSGPPVLVVIDTWARNMGGDENAVKDTMDAINTLLRLIKEYGSAVLVVHHSGANVKDRGRGSTALKAAVDFEFKFTKGNDGLISVETTKVKESRGIEHTSFRLRDVYLEMRDEEDLPIRSAVLEEAENPYADRKAMLCPSQREVYTVLEVHPEGLTPLEATGELSGKTVESVRTRLRELKNLGMARKCGNKWVTEFPETNEHTKTNESIQRSFPLEEGKGGERTIQGPLGPVCSYPCSPGAMGEAEDEEERCDCAPDSVLLADVPIQVSSLQAEEGL
jgi:hypothetical protein